MHGSQVLGLLISVTGTIMAADQARGLYRALRSRRWLPTQGRILGAITVTVRSPVGFFTSPMVAYEYTVDGETYQSQTIDYRGSVRLRAAKQTVERYRWGRRVTVYYNPKDPTLAVLEPGATAGGVMRVVLSVLLVGVGLIVFSS